MVPPAKSSNFLKDFPRSLVSYWATNTVNMITRTQCCSNIRLCYCHVNFNQGCKEIASFFLEAKWELSFIVHQPPAPAYYEKKLQVIFHVWAGVSSLEKNRGVFQFNFFQTKCQLKRLSRLFRLSQNIVLRHNKREYMTSPSIEICSNDDRVFCPSNFDLPVYNVFFKKALYRFLVTVSS